VNALTPPEHIAPPALQELSLQERGELIALVETPVFRKAWANVMLSRPSVFMGAAAVNGSDAAGTAALAKLCEIRGWELFKAAFARQMTVPARREKEPPQEWEARESL
jgi:hypothetical protein